MAMAKCITTVLDLREIARRKVPRMFFEYADRGSVRRIHTRKTTARRWKTIRFRQRVMIDVDNRNLATTIMGEPVSMPLALAPTGLDRTAMGPRRNPRGAGGGESGHSVLPEHDVDLLDRTGAARRRPSRSGFSFT